MKLGRTKIIGGAVAVIVVVVVAAIVVLPALGFGQDRQAMARQTTQSYWYDIGHGKINQAYGLLTPGTQQARPFNQYSQDMFGFLGQVAGVTAKVGETDVSGDHAVVRVLLYSPKTSAPLKAWQHLFWVNGGWRISDMNGGLSQQK